VRIARCERTNAVSVGETDCFDLQVKRCRRFTARGELLYRQSWSVLGGLVERSEKFMEVCYMTH